ncbi:hypothetical protein C1645_811711 [Glomus cerebriforme]|uniref:Uncharacterized protein n=1 Tax=Glomus cerebriforme TaxID=658196 RepID=A0A397TWJ7_9GLOM|nr:hypothetical protein C1645_811711 [Glomus cerebriforme]
MNKNMLYSEALKKTKMVTVKKDLYSNEDVKELEKVLYSKECVAECINFVVSDASKKDTILNVQERFSCSLATILARDKEVVAVRLKVLPDRCEIYLAKNFAWSEHDSNYIAKIKNYLKDISKSAPRKLRNTENAFTRAVSSYCFAKLETRLDKLKSDIKNDNRHVKSFKDFFSTNVDDADKNNMYIISQVCNEYYKLVKDDNNIPPKFLRHIKKVGSYTGSMISIIECACNIQYKLLFSNVKVYTKGSVIDNQHIYSWKDIIKRFIDEDDEDTYKRFMDKCSKKLNIMERLRKMYTNKITQQQQQLDDDDIKQCIYLHAEMHILAFIIDNNIKNSREFIAMSKRCCYLCELYIDFARKHGYDIIVFGKHKKIYSGWKLPIVKDNNFKIRSLRYILENLDQIIENKIKHYTSSLPADFDSGDNSPNLNNDDKYLDEYFKQNTIKEYTLL